MRPVPAAAQRTKGPGLFCFSLFRFQYSIVSFRMQSRRKTNRAFPGWSAGERQRTGSRENHMTARPSVAFFKCETGGSGKTEPFPRRRRHDSSGNIRWVAVGFGRSHFRSRLPFLFPAFAGAGFAGVGPVCAEPVRRPLTNGRPSDRMRSYRDGGRAAFSACFLYIDTSCIMRA